MHDRLESESKFVQDQLNKIETEHQTISDK